MNISWAKLHVLKTNLDIIEKNGFKIELPSSEKNDNSIRIKSVPISKNMTFNEEGKTRYFDY